MTIEEALTEIKERIHITEYVGSNYVDCVNIEALRMAIEALKNSERTEKSSQNVSNDDLISRKAAIDALMSWVEEHKDNAFGGCLFHWTGIKALIENLPSAQPDWNEMIVICDCCGHAIHVQRQ